MNERKKEKGNNEDSFKNLYNQNHLQSQKYTLISERFTYT